VDLLEYSENPQLSIELSAKNDIAGLKRRSNYAPIYVLENNNELEFLILPVMGVGYQSLIKAWVIVSSDLNTVQALSIIEQNETPGLGSRILESDWQSHFSGKALRDLDGNLILSVSKAGSATSQQVDGITGATRTGNGISAMIEFWFGEYGYMAFLENLARES